jgi:hypothetical protein
LLYQHSIIVKRQLRPLAGARLPLSRRWRITSARDRRARALDACCASPTSTRPYVIETARATTGAGAPARLWQSLTATATAREPPTRSASQRRRRYRLRWHASREPEAGCFAISQQPNRSRADSDSWQHFPPSPTWSTARDKRCCRPSRGQSWDASRDERQWAPRWRYASRAGANPGVTEPGLTLVAPFCRPSGCGSAYSKVTPDPLNVPRLTDLVLHVAAPP